MVRGSSSASSSGIISLISPSSRTHLGLVCHVRQVLQLQQQLLAQHLGAGGGAGGQPRAGRRPGPACGRRRRHALLQQRLLLLQQQQVLLLRAQLLLLRGQQRLLLRRAAAARRQPVLVQAGEAVARGDEVRGVGPGARRRRAARQDLLKGSRLLRAAAQGEGRRGGGGRGR